MKTGLKRAVLAAIIGLFAASALAQDAGRGRGRGSSRQRRPDAQAPQDQQQNADQPGPTRVGDGRGGRERRGGENRGPDGGRDRRGRGGPPRTPEERERFYSRMVDDQFERLTRNYELTEEQKPQVRARLEELKTQQRSFSEQRGKEFEALRIQMRALRDSGQADPQQERELDGRMHSLWDQAPLSSRNVAGEVEQLLPPEQASRGRARHEAEDQARRQRFEQMRQDWQQRRQQRESAAGQPPAEGGEAGQPEAAAPPAQDDGDNSGRDRGDRRSRGWGRDGQDRRGGFSRGGSRGNGPDIGGGPEGFRSRRGQEEGVAQAIVEDPIGPWERYVRDFIRRYNLDPAQQATAYSVLREVEQRRVAYETSHRADYERAAREGEERLKSLNTPVVRMFDELKGRLQRIPSSAQRQRAGDLPPSSQPSMAPSSRPAGEADRGSDASQREPSQGSSRE
jgi:hypothetical protein